jgi:DNA replication protein DnaC
VLIFGSPSVAKTHLSIALLRAVVEASHFRHLDHCHGAARRADESRDRRAARGSPVFFT